MKKLLGMAVLCLPFLFTGGCTHPVPPPYYAPPPPNAIANRGFQDGVEAARRDIYRRFSPNPDRHNRFRLPPVPPGQPAAIYRRGFRDGYFRTYQR